MEMNNSIFSIQPYRHQGTWVFDDDRVKLVKEPFVCGVPEMIDLALLCKQWTGSRFNMLFSATEIPEPDLVLTKDEPFAEGNWYIDQKTGMRGWLCPALYCYFTKAPKKLFIKLSKYIAEVDN